MISHDISVVIGLHEFIIESQNHFRYDGAAIEEPYGTNDVEIGDEFLQLNSWNIPADASHVSVNTLSAEYSDEYPYNERYSGENYQFKLSCRVNRFKDT